MFATTSELPHLELRHQASFLFWMIFNCKSANLFLNGYLTTFANVTLGKPQMLQELKKMPILSGFVWGIRGIIFMVFQRFSRVHLTRQFCFHQFTGPFLAGFQQPTSGKMFITIILKRWFLLRTFVKGQRTTGMEPAA